MSNLSAADTGMITGESIRTTFIGSNLKNVYWFKILFLR